MRKVITLIGGGHGLSGMINVLKKEPSFQVNTIVSVMDSGGSTGIIRYEYDALAFGDIRRALASGAENKELAKLFEYRFEKGFLAGHSLGNLILLGLAQQYNSEKIAFEKARQMFGIKNKIIPVTFDKVELVAELNNGKEIIGEANIDKINLKKAVKIKKIFLRPTAALNQEAGKLIKKSDIIIIGPGDLYTSVLCNFCVGGLKKAVSKSKAVKIWINGCANSCETQNYKLSDYIAQIDQYVGINAVDYIIYQDKPITNDPIENDLENIKEQQKLIEINRADEKKLVETIKMLNSNNNF